MSDGSIEFSVELDAKNAEKELQKLKINILKLEAELRAQTARKTALEAEMEAAGVAADNANAKLQELLKRREQMNNPTADGGLAYEDFGQGRKALDAEIKEQQAVVKGLEKDFNDAANAVDKMNAKIGETTAKIGVSEELAGELLKQLVELPPAAVEKAALGKVSDAMQALEQRSKRIVANMVRLFKNLFKAMSKLNVVTQLANTFGKSIENLFSKIKTIALYRVIRAAVSSVGEMLSNYLQINGRFIAAVGRLEGALLTLAQPVYDAVMPMLTQLVNKLAAATMEIVRFTSVLFGTTGEQAQKDAKSLYEESKALDNTGKSADKAKRALASFDEINKLAFDKDYDEKPSITPSFEYIFGDGENGGTVELKTWGEAFNNLLDTVVEKGIPKLRHSLGDFADWLNSLYKRLYDMFTAPGVMGKIIQLGENIANALNSMIQRIDWERLGKALGAGLNLAILFLVSLIYTFDWLAFGNALAQMINGAVSQIDWDAVGQLLWAGFKIAIETLAGFLLGLDMAQIAQAASQIAIGFFESIKETVKKIDWKGIGEQIKTFLVNLDWASVALAVADALNTIARDIDWQKIGEIISAGIHELFEFAKTFLANLDWEAIGHAIGEFITGIDWGQLFLDLVEIGVYLIAGLMQGMFSAAAEVDKKIIEWVQTLIQKIRDAVSAVQNWASSLFSGKTTISASMPTLNATSIPRLAQGAVIPPNSSFLAVLGDQRSGTNIETPLSTMVEAFKIAMAESSGGAQHITIEFTGDAAQFVRWLNPQIKADNARVGATL